MISSHRAVKDEEGRHAVAMKAFKLAKKKSQNLTAKLAKANRDKKSIDAVLYMVERQTEAQRK